MCNSYGVKVCAPMRKTLINKVVEVCVTTDENLKKYQDALLFLINKNIDNKFKNINDLVKNKEKLDKILKNESAFDGNLGFSLMQLFEIKPKKIMIYEDSIKTGRTIKEKTEDSDIEKFIYFIPVYIPDDKMYTADYDLKKYNNLAEENYDIIEGRYLESV